MNKHIIFILTLLAMSLGTLRVTAQEKQAYKVGIVGFYNLENLFDTINDPNKNDEEFLPQGVNQWNTEKYMSKLRNMAYAISTIGIDWSPDGVAVLGMSEMENRTVLEDLVSQPELKDRNYQVVHYDSPDRRGVDVGLIYNPKYFKPTNSKSYRTIVPEDPEFITRDQLVVSGLFDGEPMHFIHHARRPERQNHHDGRLQRLPDQQDCDGTPACLGRHERPARRRVLQCHVRPPQEGHRHQLLPRCTRCARPDDPHPCPATQWLRQLPIQERQGPQQGVLEAARWQVQRLSLPHLRQRCLDGWL